MKTLSLRVQLSLTTPSLKITTASSPARWSTNGDRDETTATATKRWGRGGGGSEGGGLEEGVVVVVVVGVGVGVMPKTQAIQYFAREGVSESTYSTHNNYMPLHV